MKQASLFNVTPYGLTPKKIEPGAQMSETSRAAAKSVVVTAATLREAVLEELKRAALTADEAAAALDQSVLAIRPRLSELKRLGLIEDSGIRRTNESGKSAAVWRVK